MNARLLVSVLLPVAVDRPYTYASDRPLQPGTIVVVPLGTREMIGVVWPSETEPVDSKRIREISAIFDTPPLPAVLVRFVDWMAEYTLTPPRHGAAHGAPLAGSAGAGAADDRRAARRRRRRSG